jgi:hypothetical protein
MKKIIVLLLIGFGIYTLQQDEAVDAPVSVIETPGPNPAPAVTANVGSSAIASRSGAIYATQYSGNQIQNSGKVIRILSDDNTGSRHQRFIISLASGQTLLVAHNIDLAPRIAALAIDDNIKFSGEYEWNSQGGVVHWTHHDPQGRHQDGWLKHRGRTYQ